MRFRPLNGLFFAVFMVSVVAQAPTLQMNVVYDFQPPYSFNFFHAWAG